MSIEVFDIVNNVAVKLILKDRRQLLALQHGDQIALKHCQLMVLHKTFYALDDHTRIWVRPDGEPR